MKEEKDEDVEMDEEQEQEFQANSGDEGKDDDEDEDGESKKRKKKVRRFLLSSHFFPLRVSYQRPREHQNRVKRQKRRNLKTRMIKPLTLK